MLQKLKPWLVLVGASLTFAGIASAMNDDKPNWPKSDSVEKRADLCSASGLVGMNIEDLEGNNVGEIKEILVDGTSGRILGVLTSHKELDGKLLILAPKAFEVVRAKDDASKIETLHFASGVDVKKGPSVSSTEWEKAFDKPLLDKLRAAAGDVSDTAKGVVEDVRKKVEGEPAKDDKVARAAEKDLDPLERLGVGRTSKMIGKNVFDAGNKVVGEVDDLYVDLKTCKVEYAIVGLGGVVGIAEDDRAVKFSMLECQKTEGQEGFRVIGDTGKGK